MPPWGSFRAPETSSFHPGSDSQFLLLEGWREMRSSVLSILAAGARRDMVERIAADLHVLLAQYMRALVLLGVVASLTYALFFR